MPSCSSSSAASATAGVSGRRRRTGSPSALVKDFSFCPIDKSLRKLYNSICITQSGKKCKGKIMKKPVEIWIVEYRTGIGCRWRPCFTEPIFASKESAEEYAKQPEEGIQYRVWPYARMEKP